MSLVLKDTASPGIGLLTLNRPTRATPCPSNCARSLSTGLPNSPKTRLFGASY